MDEGAICPIDAIDEEIEHELTLLETVTPEPEDWQETTLRRLEAWIEERERLIAELERRIGSEATTAI